MVQNAGQGEITQFYGIGTSALYSTGAGQGTEGITAAENGAPLMSVPIRNVLDSAQAPAAMVEVNLGDTFSASNDQTPPMWAGDGVPQSSAARGASAAHVVTPTHPSAAAGSGAGAP